MIPLPFFRFFVFRKTNPGFSPTIYGSIVPFAVKLVDYVIKKSWDPPIGYS